MEVGDRDLLNPNAMRDNMELRMEPGRFTDRRQLLSQLDSLKRALH